MTNREFFIERWEQEHPAFLRVLQALPPSRLDYRPHPRSRSAAELVWLLAYEEQTGSELIDTGEINWNETPPPPSLEEMIGVYEKAHSELAPRLARLDDRRWEEDKVQLVVAGQVALEETLAAMFWGVLFDAVHHRGQLSVYLRPMGGKVPSIYGPSADDMGT